MHIADLNVGAVIFISHSSQIIPTCFQIVGIPNDQEGSHLSKACSSVGSRFLA